MPVSVHVLLRLCCGFVALPLRFAVCACVVALFGVCLWCCVCVVGMCDVASLIC